MDPLFPEIPDFGTLGTRALRRFIEECQERAAAIGADPEKFVAEGYSKTDLVEGLTEIVTALGEAKEELARREAEVEAEDTADDQIAELAALAVEGVLVAQDESEPEPEPEPAEGEPAEDGEPADGDDADAEPENPPEEAAAEAEEFKPKAKAKKKNDDEDEEPEPEVEPEATAEVEEAAVEPEPEPVTASSASEKSKAKLVRLPRPARARSAVPAPVEPEKIPLVAAGENLGVALGAPVESEREVASMMMTRRRQFGNVPSGTHGEKIPIVRADWSDLYPAERVLDHANVSANMEKIDAVTDQDGIRARLAERLGLAEPLTASGGLCAPVTPYYNLQMISVADRPVRAALAAFGADRGGISVAAPAALTDISTAVGIITEEEDSGTTDNSKTCQVIDCPPFTETDVSAIFHCLQFGNLGARAFPELVEQWTQLVLAAHARTAETALLDAIGDASTAVTADGSPIGASGALPSLVLTAAAGFRSRHRMDPNAVLRVLLPAWVLDMLVSDVYKSQFGRFDMSKAQFVSLLRSGNVEPSFYIDGETGAGQVFGAQTAAGLLEFPATIVWYLFPEGSFLYLDGGTLELGLVRDSVLNETNDFQIFGETWENVAFVGVESLQITTSNVCDSGMTALPITNPCPITY